MKSTAPKSYLYYCYLALLIWIPLPLASKSLLAQDFLLILTSLLFIACLTELWRNRARSNQDKASTLFPEALRNSKWLLLLFCLHLFWLGFQIIPLPHDWLIQFSPQRLTYALPAELHTSISFYRWQSQHDLLLSFAYFQLFCLTLLLVNSRKRLTLLLYTFVGLGVFQAVYGSLMTLSGIEKALWFDKDAHIGVATGTLLNRNHLANYLTFSCAAGIALLLANLSNNSNGGNVSIRQTLRIVTQWLLGKKGVIRFSLIIMVIGLILSRSRMGNSAFFISLTSAGFIWLLLAQKLNKTTLLLFISLIVIDVFLMGTWFGLDKLAERFENTNAETELRAIALPYMLLMLKDFWLSGVGAGNFATVFPLYSEAISLRYVNEAHFDYLQFILEHGLIGFTPLLLIVLLSLWKTLTLIRHKHSRLAKSVGFAVLMVMIASGLHATVEYNLQRPATASLFIVFLALPWVVSNLNFSRSSRNKISHQVKTA